jgi:hypothetical protein
MPVRIGVQRRDEAGGVEIANVIDAKCRPAQRWVLPLAQQGHLFVRPHSDEIVEGDATQRLLKPLLLGGPKTRGFMDDDAPRRLFYLVPVAPEHQLDEPQSLLAAQVRRTAIRLRIPHEILAAQHEPVTVFVKCLGDAGAEQVRRSARRTEETDTHVAGTRLQPLWAPRDAARFEVEAREDVPGHTRLMIDLLAIRGGLRCPLPDDLGRRRYFITSALSARRKSR